MEQERGQVVGVGGDVGLAGGEVLGEQRQQGAADRAGGDQGGGGGGDLGEPRGQPAGDRGVEGGQQVAGGLAGGGVGAEALAQQHAQDRLLLQRLGHEPGE